MKSWNMHQTQVEPVSVVSCRCMSRCRGIAHLVGVGHIILRWLHVTHIFNLTSQWCNCRCQARCLGLRRTIFSVLSISQSSWNVAQWVEKQLFVFCHCWNVKASCKCCHVWIELPWLCFAPQQSAAQQPPSPRPIGGAISHEIPFRRLPTHDPLWGLDCSLLMGVQSVGSFARQVALMSACGLHSSPSYWKIFSIHLFAAVV